MRVRLARLAGVVLALIFGAAVYSGQLPLAELFDPVPGQAVAVLIPMVLLLTALAVPSFLAAVDTVVCVIAVALLGELWLGVPISHTGMSATERGLATGLMLATLILAGGGVLLSRSSGAAHQGRGEQGTAQGR